MSEINSETLPADFYTPLSDAVEELSKRRKSPALMQLIQENLKLTPELEILFKKTHLVMFRQVATPLNEVLRVIHIAKQFNLDFLIIEYIEDKFTPSINLYKYGLGKLPIYNGEDSKHNDIISKINIVDFARMEGLPLSSVLTHNKESLVDLHHDLFEETTGLNITKSVIDASSWLLKFKGAAEYYKHFFQLFIAHNILAEIYLQSENEGDFTKKVIYPIYSEIETEYKCKPLIWNYLEADSQTKYFWDCYPKSVGDLLKIKRYYY